jgi:acyl-coenzyme A thioesterase PaaI-like protein
MVDRKKRREELLASYERAPIRKTLGMVLSFNDRDESLLDLQHNPGFEHGMRDTHGGIIATLLDTAGWFSAKL